MCFSCMTQRQQRKDTQIYDIKFVINNKLNEPRTQNSPIKMLLLFRWKLEKKLNTFTFYCCEYFFVMLNNVNNTIHVLFLKKREQLKTRIINCSYHKTSSKLNFVKCSALFPHQSLTIAWTSLQLNKKVLLTLPSFFFVHPHKGPFTKSLYIVQIIFKNPNVHKYSYVSCQN